jgi:hypothetical protein
VDHDKQALTLRLTKEHETLLVLGMERVRYEDRERIAKDSGRFRERNAVLILVAPGFNIIPLETKSHSVIIAGGYSILSRDD